MERTDSPYVFRDEVASTPNHDPRERDVVIVDGQAMSYRVHRRR